jgi:hypothetical protein
MAFLPFILDHFILEHPHHVGPDVDAPLTVRLMAHNHGRLRSAVIADAGAASEVEGNSTPSLAWAIHDALPMRHPTVNSGTFPRLGTTAGKTIPSPTWPTCFA